MKTFLLLSGVSRSENALADSFSLTNLAFRVYHARFS